MKLTSLFFFFSTTTTFHRRNSVSSSVSDLVGSPLEISVDNIVTIEELRMQLGSCFTCGVSWAEDHVSLDCSECGGYSMERPCPLCDGCCGATWKRDFAMVRMVNIEGYELSFVPNHPSLLPFQSHASGNARWLGCCPQTNANSVAVSSMQSSSSNLLGMLANGAAAAAAVAVKGGNNTCSAATGQLMAHELCARLEKLSAQT